MTRFAARALGASSLILACASVAVASGCATKNESASQLGRSYAGVSASAEDVTTIYFNPANMGFLEGDHVVLGSTLIFPSLKPKNSRASNALAAPIAGGQSSSYAVDGTPIPSIHMMKEINKDVKFGLSATVPWGLATSYDDNWVGRYYGVTSKLTTYNVNPAIGWRINEQWSVGGGVQVQYAKARVATAIDCGTINALLALGIPGLTPTASDCFADHTGSDTAFGFNLGAIYAPTEALRFGVSYRSKIEHDVDGSVRYTLPTPLLAGVFGNGAASTSVTTPATLNIGAHYELNPQWSIGAEWQWTEWSELKELRFRYANSAQDAVKDYKWKDTMFASVGATYTYTDAWKIRGGLAYDQSPTRDNTRDPVIPDNNRYWISLGTTYNAGGGWHIDATYLHGIFDKPKVNLSAADPNNAAKGNLQSEYDAQLNILGLQARYTF